MRVLECLNQLGRALGLLVLVGYLTGCSDSSHSNTSTSTNKTAQTSKSSSANASTQQVFQVKGVLKKVNLDEKRVSIKHEAIPNYMVAMTMPFNVKDTNELKDLKIEDQISFRLTVTEEESWIDQLQKLNAATANANPAVREPVRVVRDVDPIEVGDVIYNYPFTNELGQAVSLNDFRGKAVALTFIFTRCPIPDFCPLMSKRFASTHKLLTENANAPTNWHLLSISFDPHFDTPAVLKRHAELYNYNPAKWSFVTGAMIEIDAITEQFDVEVFKQSEDWSHKLRTAVIDTQGRVQKIFPYNQWTPEELAEQIIKAAKVKPGDPLVTDEPEKTNAASN